MPLEVSSFGAPMVLRFVTAALKFVAFVAYLAGLPLLMLWLSGNWHWIQGWIFGSWFFVLFGICLFWMYFKDPALLDERLRVPGTGGESRFDLVILTAVKVGFIGWFFLPSLDVRYGWTSRQPMWGEMLGGIALLSGSFFLFRSITDNTFLSQVVRIQTDRGHRVVDTGVYGFVRHPMYLGVCLILVGGPLLLGSATGLIPGVAVILLLILRIMGEEKLLIHDLLGYQAYRQKVRYRLVPHVW